MDSYSPRPDLPDCGCLLATIQVAMRTILRGSLSLYTVALTPARKGRRGSFPRGIPRRPSNVRGASQG
jgi:hypothetical protein